MSSGYQDTAYLCHFASYSQCVIFRGSVHMGFWNQMPHMKHHCGPFNLYFHIPSTKVWFSRLFEITPPLLLKQTLCVVMFTAYPLKLGSLFVFFYMEDYLVDLIVFLLVCISLGTWKIKGNSDITDILLARLHDSDSLTIITVVCFNYFMVNSAI
jgi:hypothetical protein